MDNVTLGVLDTLQKTAIQQGNQNKKKKQHEYYFDKFKMFFGEDYFVKNIRISQPTIGDILKIGEKNFYGALAPFINNSTSIRLMLWKGGIDWCNVSDIEVYQILINTLTDTTPLKLIFPDIDFSQFRIREIFNSKEGEKNLCLYNPTLDLILYEEDYMEIAEYIREMLSIHPKVEKAKGKIAKQWMIQEDEQNLLNKTSDSNYSLLSMVSFLINHPGFKYDLESLKKVGICMFYDSVKRLQLYEMTRALLQGSYSRFCDTSKIDKEQFNFTRNIEN